MKPLIIAAAIVISACAGDSSMTDTSKPMDLGGSEWGSLELGDAFVQFQSGGKIIGHGGCNRFFGSYAQDGNAVEIRPLGATKMMCPPPQMQIENTLLGSLQSADRIEATHLVLILADKNGKPLLELTRRDWD